MPFFRESASIEQARAWALPESDWITRIAADPDNEALRLAYAEWLIKNHNPLGKFIRLECELEHADRASAEYYQWESERARLAYEGADWKDSLMAKWRKDGINATAEANFYATLRRGMLEELTISNLPAFLAHQEEIFRQAPLIRGLKVEEAKEADELRVLLQSPALARMREIEFSDCELDRTALEAIAGSQQLETLTTLRFVQCTVDSEGLAELFRKGRFSGLKSAVLEQLMFHDGSDHDKDQELLQAIFSAAACPRLDSIDLRGSTFFSSLGVRELISGPLRPRLKALFVNGDGASSEDMEELIATSFEALRTLEISRGNHAQAKLRLAADSRLQALSLGDMRLDDKAVQSVLKSVPATIRDLTIQGGTMTSKSAKVLAMLPQLKKLGFLCLADNQIDSQGAAAIAESPVLTKLAALKLGWNTIDAQGARAIAESASLRSLRFLHLGNNRLGDEGAAALGAATNLGNLIWLNVDENGLSVEENELSDKAVRSLLDSPRLKNLAILRADSRHLAESMAERFAERFGNYDSMAAYSFYARLI